MLQTHQQLKIISEEYNSLFSKNEFYPLQKAYSTPHFLALSVRFPGRTETIYIGRGNQYQGIFLHKQMPPPYLRVQDRLLDYLRKHLVGARLGKIMVDEKTMSWYFHFKNDHADNTFVVGYKERQLFFAKQSKEEVYLSWSGETLESKNLLALVDSFGPDKITNHLEQKVQGIEDYLLAEEKKIGGQPLQRKKEIFLIRKIKNISDDLENVKNWKSLQDDLQENRLDLNLDELRVYGQKIKLLGSITIWSKRDLVFKKIKKLKRAEEILTSRLSESRNELENVKRGEFQFDVTKEKIIQPLWSTHQKQTSPQSGEHNVKSVIIKKLSGIIGLDANSNDWIRSQASKNHYWFHIENYSSAHCIIKSEDITCLSFEDFGAIGSMLRDFSKLEISEIPIVYTQVKNIKGIKGTKGAVAIKKQKHFRCVYGDWKERITII